MRRKMILVLILFLLPVSVFAGEYVLVKGKGVEVCEAYKKNLESFNEPEPMVCERKINPEFKDFEKPVWEKIDLEKNRELFRAIEIKTIRLAENHPEADLDNSIQWHKDRNYEHIKVTKIDIDNDGIEDEVLIYSYDSCYTSRYFITDLYVLTKDRSMIDVNNPTDKLIEATIGRGENSRGYMLADIFKYKNTTYVDLYCYVKWKHVGCKKEDTLIVYKISDGKMEDICKYEYKYKGRRSWK